MNPQDTDLSSCELEPIRFPGAVQPSGALLVVQRASGVIEAASETCDVTLGWRADALLGKTLASLLGEHPQATRWTASFASCPPPLDFSLKGKTWWARPQFNEAGQVLIDIEPYERDSALLRGLVQGWRQDLPGLRALGDVESVARQAAKSIGGITGFDRVMIYRFDGAWNGEVVAEACRDNHDQFLGHYFPASDIPKQARDLFQLSNVRQIADALYRPAALIARGQAQAIDLGPSSLRSVSPLHLEYLKNMGVRATLTGALMVEGRLWGLVACHHLGGPKYLGPAEREAFGWICGDLAALIGATVARKSVERISKLATLRRELSDRIRQADFREMIQQAQGADLLAVLGADGFAQVAGNSIDTFGRTPELSRIKEIQRRACERAADPYFYVSNALGRDLGLSEASDGVAGAIIVCRREKPDFSLLWFRNERSMTTRWAGDPDRAHTVAADGRVSPRKSFAEFIKVIRGQCLPWTPEELESASEMRSLIEIQVLWEFEVKNQQVQKSESLGRMAGAVAHHFNNQLQLVMLNLELELALAGSNRPSKAEAGGDLAVAMQATRKAAELSGQMLTYLGQSHVRKEPLDLAETCRQSLALLKSTLLPRVEVETDLPSPGPGLHANASQIKQVLLNLITNALEARSAERGAIRLSVKTVSAAEILAADHFPVDWQPQATAYACLEVTDRGAGIAAAEIQKIFDPFYSTKFTGRGLGLSVVLGIARSHDGVVMVKSEPGRGSAFRVCFPELTLAVPKERVPVQLAPVRSKVRPCTVLVVEDNSELRETLALALEFSKFKVFTAGDGIEAMELFRQHRDEIDCVLCDVVMPRMNGWETLIALRQLEPGLPVILASGYDETEAMQGDHAERPQAFLKKPFELAECEKALRRLVHPAGVNL